MIAPEPRYLVVGADGLVGAGLCALLEGIGTNVTGTTRRALPRSSRNRIFLDLADAQSFALPARGFSVAFLCAAITGMAACEDEPARTQRINVLNTVALARRLLDAGAGLIYLSSNTVFDGKIAWPNEDTPYSPANEYGRQKADVEQALLSLSAAEASIAIVRLSKVMTPRSGTAADFINRLASSAACPAFDDLLLSPISLDYATGGLLAVANGKANGVFHLSGEEEMSYAEFARRLALHIGADPALVRPGPSVASAAKLTFRPVHPGLGMQRTRELLCIGPEPTPHLMAALAPQEAAASSRAPNTIQR